MVYFASYQHNLFGAKTNRKKKKKSLSARIFGLWAEFWYHELLNTKRKRNCHITTFIAYSDLSCHFSLVFSSVYILFSTLSHLIRWISATFLASCRNPTCLLQKYILPSSVSRTPPPALSRWSIGIRPSHRGNRIHGGTHTCSCRVETLGRGSAHTVKERQRVITQVYDYIKTTS